MKVRVEAYQDKGMALFEASCNDLAKQGLKVEDGAVEPNEHGDITLCIHNPGLAPVCLGEGESLGWIESATTVPITSAETQSGMAEVQVNRLHANTHQAAQE